MSTSLPLMPHEDGWPHGQSSKPKENNMNSPCADCDDAIGTVFAEDLTGYHPKGGDWLCARCYDKRCDYPEPDRAWPQARNE